MKLIILTVFVCVMHLNYSYSQNAFYDAQKLKERFSVGTDTTMVADSVFILIPDADSVYLILGNYAMDTSSKNTIASEYQNNPFLRPDLNSAQGSLSGIINRGFKSLGGLDVTKFANAIADIMIERAKQELTIAFFDRFKKIAEKYPEFQTLFPTTTNNLSNLLSYTYPQMLPRLRDGFFDDVEQITFHLEALLELPKYRTLFDNFPEIRVVIRVLRLIHELETGDSNAADIIKKFSEFPEWNPVSRGSTEFQNLGSTVNFMAVLSEGLRNEDTTKIWVSTKEIRGFITNDTLTRIFLGLIWQKVKTKGITYRLGQQTVQLKDLFAKQRHNIFLMQNKISQFISVADKVNAAFIDIRKKNKDKINITNEDYFNYIDVSLDAIDFSFGIVKLFDKELQSENYLTIARKSNNLYKHIYTKEYTQAVADAWDIITKVQQLCKKTNTSTVVATSIVDGALSHENASNNLLSFIEKVKPYALFIANMVDAKDEKEVKAALENVILPVGSSSIKKNTSCNVSIQTYLGAFFTPANKTSTISGTWSDRFGVTAPIGISWTPNFLSWQKAGSLSLFGSLFDIGAIVDYKLKKEPNPTSSDPNATVINKDYKIELGQIFSPGVYAVYGFGANLPLALGFGAQYGPGLSKIDAGNNTVITNPSWRWNLFLAVDLPFFNVLNKPKNK